MRALLAVSLGSLMGLAAACGDLKSASAPGDPAADGGDGGPGGDGAPDGSGLVEGGSDAEEGDGGPKINGDPRFALWPIPADDPPSDVFIISPGADGAIVRDKITGLLWQDTTSGQTYDFDGARAYCDALVYDLASDWRMPTRIETISIMKIKPGLGESEVTASAFTPVTADCVWTASRTSTTTLLDGFRVTAASIDALDGTSTKCAARCVRGGAPLGAPIAKQYVLDPTTARDTATGLLWERNPPTTTGTLADADARCKALSLGTPAHAMRLPTFKELASLVDETRTAPAAPLSLGIFRERAFSSNPRWTVDFDNGAGINGPTGFDHAARCVYGP